MRFLAPLRALAAVALAGCAPAAPDPTDPVPIPEERPAPAPVATLAGEWRVAAIDGRDFDEPYGLALSADAEEIWWAPRCAGLVRTYRITGSRLTIGPAKGTRTPRPGEPGPAVCAIGRPPRIDEVTRAIDSATAIRRTASNGVELSGGGHSLLLFTQ